MRDWQRVSEMNRPYRLKITRSDFDELRDLVLQDWPKEAGAFALAGVATHSGGSNIIVRRPLAVPADLFRVQHEYRLEVQPKAINGLIALCESNGSGAVICHSHPNESPYSPSDDYGEQRIIDTLRAFIPERAPTASLMFYPEGVRGRVWLPGVSRPVPLSEITVIGRAIERIRCNGTQSIDTASDSIFDRQVRAFGEAGQTVIRRARVGIVGVGGTGSSVAEQLARLGTEDLVLIDPDVFEASNLTRVYGTDSSALQRPWWPFSRKPKSKAELVAASLRRINPRINVRALPMNVVLHDAVAHLLDRDVIFLCTDEHWGRSIVNQIAYQYFIPTINLGMSIAADNGHITGAAGVVDVLRPDQPCLWCKQFLNADRITAESIPSEARESLQREGYVEGLDAPAPSVVSTTTTIAGLGVTLYLQLLTDFMGKGGNISRQNYNIMDGTVRRGTTMISPNCICKTVRAFGDLKGLPTLANIDYLSPK